MSTDLMTRVLSAAEAAIRDEARAFEDRPQTIKGLTLEIVLGPTGTVGDVSVYLERRTAGGALLARKAAS